MELNGRIAPEACRSRGRSWHKVEGWKSNRADVLKILNLG